jgi:hypothetical protein
MEETIKRSAKEESLKEMMKSCKNKFYNIEYVYCFALYSNSIYFIAKMCLILILISRSNKNIEKELVSNFIIPEAQKVILRESQNYMN